MVSSYVKEEEEVSKKIRGWRGDGEGGEHFSNPEILEREKEDGKTSVRNDKV